MNGEMMVFHDPYREITKKSQAARLARLAEAVAPEPEAERAPLHALHTPGPVDVASTFRHLKLRPRPCTYSH